MPERTEMSHREESKSGLCDSQEGEQMCKISLLSLLHLALPPPPNNLIPSSSPMRRCTLRIKDHAVPHQDSNPRHTVRRFSISGVGLWEFSRPGGATVKPRQL